MPLLYIYEHTRLMYRQGTIHKFCPLFGSCSELAAQYESNNMLQLFLQKGTVIQRRSEPCLPCLDIQQPAVRCGGVCRT